jgi:hypothetical protein
LESVEVWLYSFLISALDGGKWSASRPGGVTLENNSGTHLVGNWMGLRASLSVLKKRKIFYLCLVSNLGPSFPYRELKWRPKGATMFTLAKFVYVV